MLNNQIAGDAAAATAKSALSTAIVGATILGFTIQEAAALLGGAFIIAQFCHLAWKWRCEYVDRKAFEAKLMEPRPLDPSGE